MDELTQIATILGSLGIHIEKIAFTADAVGGPGPSDADSVYVILNYMGKKYIRSYTLEEIESAIITDARTAPAASPVQKHKLIGLLSRILTR